MVINTVIEESRNYAGVQEMVEREVYPLDEFIKLCAGQENLGQLEVETVYKGQKVWEFNAKKEGSDTNVGTVNFYQVGETFEAKGFGSRDKARKLEHKLNTYHKGNIGD